MPTDTELEVLNANAAFYEAFKRRDLAAMRALWSTRNLVACIHPGWQVLYGREEVMASWAAILTSEASPPIEHAEPRAFVLGGSAFVTCLESVFEDELVATNVFVREGDDWKIVHHQAGPFRRRDAGPEPSTTLN